MLERALGAGLPVITAMTRDPINTQSVLAYLTNKRVVKAGKKIIPGSVSYAFGGIPRELLAQGLDSVYDDCLTGQSSIVILNPEHEIDGAFNAGDLPVPTEMVAELIDAVIDDGYKEAALTTFGGLTLKEIGEVIRLSSLDGPLTPPRLLAMRKKIASRHQGVHLVDLDHSAYVTPFEIYEWLEQNAEFFNAATPKKIRPRGLLFDGPPGTGKTTGAKHIAQALNVALYRIDLGGLMGRYVGESESNLSSALSMISSSQPCVVLFDEIEKVFQSDHDSGVSSRMMSQLLWWLQEHNDLVLSIMTTNSLESVPKELYRPGRIDEVITLNGLPVDEAEDLVRKLHELLAPGMPLSTLMNEVTSTLYEQPDAKVPPAVVEREYIRRLKAAIIYMKNTQGA